MKLPRHTPRLSRAAELRGFTRSRTDGKWRHYDFRHYAASSARQALEDRPALLKLAPAERALPRRSLMILLQELKAGARERIQPLEFVLSRK